MPPADDSKVDDKTSSDDTGSPEGQDDDNDDKGFDPERAKAKIKKANDEAKNLRARLKELEPIAQKLKEEQDAKKSDLEKLTEERDSVKSEYSKAQMELIRLRIAVRKGLTETQAKRLIGDTEEELEADADELLESFGGKKLPSDRPSEKLKPGGSQKYDDDRNDFDPEDVASKIRRYRP